MARSDTTVLSHGIRQLRARAHMRPLARALEKRGIATHYADYGYVLIPTTNEKAVQAIQNAVRPGEDLACYSNSCWAAVQAAERGLDIRHLVLISPALNVETKFPVNIETITVFYTPSDRVTPLGKLWRRLTRIVPWRWKNPHGWGEMGTKGPATRDARVIAHRLDDPVGHGWFQHPPAVNQVADEIVRIRRNEHVEPLSD